MRKERISTSDIQQADNKKSMPETRDMSDLSYLHPVVLKANNCAYGLNVFSAYFSIRDDGFIEVLLVTAHKLWDSDTPYQSPTCIVKIFVNGTLHAIHRKFSTVGHRSSCGLFRGDGLFESVTHMNLEIWDQSEMVCNVDVTRIEKRETVYSLVAVSFMRNPIQVRDWILYHLNGDFNHIVIYDDNSTTPISHVLREFVSRKLVTVVDWSFMSSHGARQFCALQHFAFVFAEMATWVLYMDDDWFFPSRGENGKPLMSILKDAYEQNIWQVTVLSHWHGACTTPEIAARFNLSVIDCFLPNNNTTTVCPVLDGRSIPPQLIFSGRHSAVAELISVPSIKGGKPQMTSASFVRTRQHPLIAHLPHFWKCSATGICSTHIVGGYQFRHFKVYDFRRHQVKSTAGNWGGTKGNLKRWLTMNRDLCKVSRAPTPPSDVPGI